MPYLESRQDCLTPFLKSALVHWVQPLKKLMLFESPFLSKPANRNQLLTGWLQWEDFRKLEAGPPRVPCATLPRGKQASAFFVPLAACNSLQNLGTVLP